MQILGALGAPAAATAISGHLSEELRGAALDVMVRDGGAPAAPVPAMQRRRKQPQREFADLEGAEHFGTSLDGFAVSGDGSDDRDAGRDAA